MSRLDDKSQSFRFQMSPDIHEKKTSLYSPLTFMKTHKSAFKSVRPPASGTSFDDSGNKKKKVRNPPHDLAASVPGSGTAAGNDNFSTKSCFPLRAAVPSVQVSRMRSSCRARGSVRETDGTHRTRLLALLPSGCQSVCFVASDQPTRTGGSAPVVVCEVGAAHCCSQDRATKRQEESRSGPSK